MKHKIYEFSLVLKILYFVSKGSLNILEYRCLLICNVKYLHTIEPAVENIVYFRFQLISVTLLTLNFQFKNMNMNEFPVYEYEYE